MIIKISGNEIKAKQIDLISESRFSEILQFLVDKKGQATLRDLKRAFPNEDITDEYIDSLVLNHLITRHHGRYAAFGEVITKEYQLNLKENCETFLDSHLEEIKKDFEEIKTEKDSFKVIHYLGNFEEINDVVYYEETENSVQWLSLPMKLSKVLGKKSEFISLGSYYPHYNHHITDFFNYLKREQINVPIDFINLRNILGDINPSYFINYSERKLRRLSRGKQIPVEKADIFMEALLSMGYISVNNEFYEFNMLDVNLADECVELNNLLESLMTYNEELTTEKKESHYLIRAILLNWLLENNIISLPKTLHAWG